MAWRGRQLTVWGRTTALRVPAAGDRTGRRIPMRKLSPTMARVERNVLSMLGADEKQLAEQRWQRRRREEREAVAAGLRERAEFLLARVDDMTPEEADRL